MKKVSKVIVTVCALALVMACAVMLVGCGDKDKGTEYTYSKAEITGDNADEMSNVTTMYDALYKDSKLVVGSKNIKWTIADNEGTMTYTKDGDKYVLGGDYAKQITDSLKGMAGAGATVEIELYGLETEGGFNIVIDEKVSMPETDDMHVKMTLQFTKAA